MVRIFFLGMLLWGPRLPEPSTTLTIRFEGIRHADGYIFVGIYEDQQSWDKRLPSREVNLEKWSMKDGCLTGTLTDLKPGKTYGLAVLDDANANNVVDMGFLFPLEGFGFSNFQVRGLHLPCFQDFAFTYPVPDTVVVKMHYLGF